MTAPADTPDLDPAALAELSALADGTLPESERGRVQSRIDSSPQLRALYERERQVVAMLQRARETDRAPASLRARIEAQRPSTAVRARRRLAFGGSLAVALAAVVTALVLILPSGTPVLPTVDQAAALATLPPTAGAPGPDPASPEYLLDAHSGSLHFPNWEQQFGGWRAVGQRTDRISGRDAVTVYYTWNQHTAVYTIVDAPALKQPNTSSTWVNGTELHTLSTEGRLTITWQRDDHTCVLTVTGPGVPPRQLDGLAASNT